MMKITILTKCASCYTTHVLLDVIGLVLTCCKVLISVCSKFSCRNELFHSKPSTSGHGEDFGEGLQCTCWCFSHLYSLMVFSSLVFPTFLSTSSLTQTNSRHQGSRRRQKGSDYTSTSDEEYDSNQSTPKYKRSQPSSASHSPKNQSRPRPQPVVALHPRPSSRDSEEDNPERQTLHNWTNHSVEIARSGILLQMLICILKMKLMKDSFI